MNTALKGTDREHGGSNRYTVYRIKIIESRRNKSMYVIMDKLLTAIISIVTVLVVVQ